MWIEWDEGLINLAYAKQVYIKKSSHSKNWYVNIILSNKDEEYVRCFEKKQDAEECFENIKKSLVHTCSFNFGIPC